MASFTYLRAYAATVLRGLPAQGLRLSFREIAVLPGSGATVAGPHSGPPPLIVAALAGDPEVVQELLTGRADIHVRIAADVPNFYMLRGESPLHVAARCGHSSVVEQLLHFKAEVSACDARGAQPLVCAVVGGSMQIVRLIVEGRADLEVQSNLGTTALDSAVIFQRLPCAEALIQAGASTAPNRLGLNCLHYAAVFGSQAGTVRRLIELRVAPDVAFNLGWSQIGVLYFVASLPHRLLRSSSFFSVLTYHSKGGTPLMLAACFKRTAEVKELLEGQADPHRRNARGKTPLEVVRLLGQPAYELEVLLSSA